MFTTTTVQSTQQVVYAQDYTGGQVLQVQELASWSKPAWGTAPTADCFRLVIVLEGVYTYTLGKREMEVAGPALFLIRPGEPFDLPGGYAAAGCVVTFSRSFLSAVFSSSAILEALQLNGDALRNVPIPAMELPFVKEVADRLVVEYADNGMKGEMVISLFHLLVLFLKRSISSQVPIDGIKRHYHIKRFFVLLEKHFHVYKMPGDYAELMAVTPSYLNYLIKESFGFTTSYFIHQRILAEAKRLVTYDEMNMKEIAYKLGFEDSSHFSKFFKRISGSKFTEFKRSIVV